MEITCLIGQRSWQSFFHQWEAFLPSVTNVYMICNDPRKTESEKQQPLEIQAVLHILR